MDSVVDPPTFPMAIAFQCAMVSLRSSFTAHGHVRVLGDILFNSFDNHIEDTSPSISVCGMLEVRGQS